MLTSYSKSSHSVYRHRYHLVWITKYRYKVLSGKIQEDVRTIVSQVSEGLGVKIFNGVVSRDHVHIYCSIPPHISVGNYIKMCKGRSSRKIQSSHPSIRNRYWGRHFWGRGYFSSTSGNVTDEIINEYINNHVDAHQPDNEQVISLE